MNSIIKINFSCISKLQTVLHKTRQYLTMKLLQICDVQDDQKKDLLPLEGLIRNTNS